MKHIKLFESWLNESYNVRKSEQVTRIRVAMKNLIDLWKSGEEKHGSLDSENWQYFDNVFEMVLQDPAEALELWKRKNMTAGSWSFYDDPGSVYEKKIDKLMDTAIKSFDVDIVKKWASEREEVEGRWDLSDDYEFIPMNEMSEVDNLLAKVVIHDLTGSNFEDVFDSIMKRVGSLENIMKFPERVIEVTKDYQSKITGKKFGL